MKAYVTVWHTNDRFSTSFTFFFQEAHLLSNEKKEEIFFVTVYLSSTYIGWLLSLWLLSVKCNQFFWGRDGSNHFLLHLPIRFFFLHRSYTNMRVVVQIGSCKSLVLFLYRSTLLIALTKSMGTIIVNIWHFGLDLCLQKNEWLTYIENYIHYNYLRTYETPFTIWSLITFLTLNCTPLVFWE